MGLLFVAPAGVLVLVLVALPLLRVLWDSFRFVNLVNPAQQGWAGLENYRAVLDDEEFLPAVLRTVVWTVLSVAGEYVLGLASALALAEKVRGRAAFRAIITIPWIIPIVVAGLTWTWMLTPDYGVVNAWLLRAGIIGRAHNWLGQTETALLAVTFVNVWRSFPFYTISLLAGLQTVPRDLYEAAAIDGAGTLRRFWHITLPRLRGISLTLVVMHFIWTAINFDFIWVMTEGGPLNSSQTLPVLVYRYALQRFDVGAASVVATFMILFMVTFMVLRYAVGRSVRAEA
jgi:multiple sugar transport system permease protein